MGKRDALCTASSAFFRSVTSRMTMVLATPAPARVSGEKDISTGRIDPSRFLRSIRTLLPGSPRRHA
ncbi:MAG: hypothetical protein A4E73_00228 [Syntrophaceae bacterium PtaU1.Bin231]|nr:MAG: hypothetical protein A4E73_00228 [Syntrophaceae bacterium PtaU1.Bin231]